MSGVSNLDVSRVESVIIGINPQFGMHDGELSCDDSSSFSGSDDNDSDTRYCIVYQNYPKTICLCFLLE